MWNIQIYAWCIDTWSCCVVIYYYIDLAYDNIWHYSNLMNNCLSCYFWSYTDLVIFISCLVVDKKTLRVSHNQGYHLVCTWGQKWSFLYCAKNNCTWKSITNSVWNPNFAKLSLKFIEIQQLGKPQSDETFLCWGCYTSLIWYTIYWVLLMMFINWTY